MTVPLWVWAATVAAIAVLVVVDVLHARSPHEVGFREAATWSGVYLAAALLFGVGVLVVAGGEAGTEFFAGFLVEKSLSVDNLFIFAVVLGQFAVPARHQQKVLLWGVIGALVMRAVFIVLGAELIARFAWVFVLFGLFLLYTAVNLVRSHGHEPSNMRDNRAVRLVRRVLPVHEGDEDDPGGRHDGQLFRRIDGRLGVTPLFIVVAVILSVDLVFALDSIPAIFGITQSAYLVFTTNAFALLGLRALYFLLVGLLDRLVHLSYGLAFILAFIGVKLILLYVHEQFPDTVPAIPTWLSLTVIVVTLAVVTVTSLRATRATPTTPTTPAAPTTPVAPATPAAPATQTGPAAASGPATPAAPTGPAASPGPTTPATRVAPTAPTGPAASPGPTAPATDESDGTH